MKSVNLLLLALAVLAPREGLAQSTASSPQAQASQAEARKLSDAFVNVAERVSPSVVQVDVTVRDESANSTDQMRQFVKAWRKS